MFINDIPMRPNYLIVATYCDGTSEIYTMYGESRAYSMYLEMCDEMLSSSRPIYTQVKYYYWDEATVDYICKYFQTKRK